MFHIVILLILVLDSDQRSIHFQDSLSDEGVLMEIDDKNEDEEMIKINELRKYNLHNFFWHLPKEKKKVKRYKNAKIRKPDLQSDIFYDMKDVLKEKIRRKELKRTVRKSNWYHPMKRDTAQNHTDEYVYDQLKAEYYEGELEEIKLLEEMNVTVRVEPKHEVHNVQDALKPIVDIKVPKKCTDKDRTGYGIRAIECAFKDLHTKGFTRAVGLRFQKIIVFWFLIYLAVATPLWLVKGWCCCCWFRCGLCFPGSVVRKIRQQLVNNPPGVITLPDGKTRRYTPSKYEMELFSSLEVSTHSF